MMYKEIWILTNKVVGTNSKFNMKEYIFKPHSVSVQLESHVYQIIHQSIFKVKQTVV